VGQKSFIFHSLKKLFFAMCICLAPSVAAGQNNHWEFGISGGGTTYFGDIASSSFALKPANPALGFFIKKEWAPFFSLKTSLVSTSLSGDDYLYPEQIDRLNRGFYFNTKVIELALTSEWDPLKTKDQQRFSPTIFFGPAIFFIDPQANFERNKLDGIKEGIIFDQMMDFPDELFGFIGGIGVNLRVVSDLYVNASAGLRVPFTDHLDGISAAANPEKDDWYGTATMSLTYRVSRSDDDADGIINKKDRCPQIPGLESFEGCPDTDNDGIEDQFDECPLDPGVIELFGCPDSDGDGITDKMDLCPVEPGSPLNKGCPYKDSDGDGIDDTKDECPFTAGTKDLAGCPEIDTDGDGILDEEDDCPETFGIAIFGGCPDSDGDGIEDAKDECPEKFGLYEHNGCPPKLTPKELAEALNGEHIYFETGKYDPVIYYHLNEVAEFLRQHPGFKLKLNGYSDSVGKREQNKYVSRKRAKNCYNYLIEKGIPASRMSYYGYGERDPVASNKTAEGRQLNRRVEIELYR
jgi:OOP family OmpA-OmpF porin